MSSTFQQQQLSGERAAFVNRVALPRRQRAYASPADWRDEIIYFLLPDRFSDGQEQTRPLLDPANRQAARPAGFHWNNWAESGGARWQGGTIAGVTSKLAYLAATRCHRRYGSVRSSSSARPTTVITGTRSRIFSTSIRGSAHARTWWSWSALRTQPACASFSTSSSTTPATIGYTRATSINPLSAVAWFYTRGRWRTRAGLADVNRRTATTACGRPSCKSENIYTRAGEGSLSAGSFDDPHAEFRRTDFVGLRDVNFDGTSALDDLARCYKYWIALTDCDGFRIDTLKHVDAGTGRNFCGAIKEFAANLGKADFFLVGEVAGDDDSAERYREVFGTNLNATLDIGGSRRLLHAVAKGLAAPGTYFDFVRAWNDDLGSHRNAGRSHVSILDDHDHVSGDKVRFSSDAASDHQVVAGVAIQLFSLGIPCVYYGTEQAFAGPEKSERDQYLPDYTPDRRR